MDKSTLFADMIKLLPPDIKVESKAIFSSSAFIEKVEVVRLHFYQVETVGSKAFSANLHPGEESFSERQSHPLKIYFRSQ